MANPQQPRRLELVYEGHDRVRVVKAIGTYRQSFVVDYAQVEDQMSKLHTARMSEAADMFNLPWSMEEELPRLLPWAVHLPDDERVVMLKELATALAESPASWAQCLLEWQRTAEVYADPALRRSLVDRDQAMQYRDVTTLDAIDEENNA